MRTPERTYEQHVAWVKSGRLPERNRIWRVTYLGKVLFEARQYSHCVVYKKQFIGQKDYLQYKII